MESNKTNGIKKPDGIRDEIAYFRKVVENMDKKELMKIEQGNDLFDHAETSDEIENLCPVDDEYFCGNLIDWIELVKNTDLHKALKSLNKEEQTLLGYLYYKDKTQSEVARIYKVKRQTINEKLTKTISKIKRYLCNK